MWLPQPFLQGTVLPLKTTGRQFLRSFPGFLVGKNFSLGNLPEPCGGTGESPLPSGAHCWRGDRASVFGRVPRDVGLSRCFFISARFLPTDSYTKASLCASHGSRALMAPLGWVSGLPPPAPAPARSLAASPAAGRDPREGLNTPFPHPGTGRATESFWPSREAPAKAWGPSAGLCCPIPPSPPRLWINPCTGKCDRLWAGLGWARHPPPPLGWRAGAGWWPRGSPLFWDTPPPHPSESCRNLRPCQPGPFWPLGRR